MPVEMIAETKKCVIGTYTHDRDVVTENFSMSGDSGSAEASMVNAVQTQVYAIVADSLGIRASFASAPRSSV